MAQQPGLTAVGGPLDRQFFPLQEGETIIGTAKDCSMQINWDAWVSRHHARIVHQSGLYWLEDLGSTNGTYLTAPSGEKRKLKKEESALLLDGALIQFGKTVQLCVTGLSASQEDAHQMLAERLQQVLTERYAGLQHMPPEDRARQLDWLRDFEQRLRTAQSEEELLMIASEGTQTLFGTLHAEPTGNDLPPLPEGLPDPAFGNQVKSILNYFISDIHKRFPREDDRDG